MDIELIKSELFSKMEPTIDRLHRLNQNQQGSSAVSSSVANYKDFKKELKEVVFYIIDKHKIEFRNAEESHDFLYDLKPCIDDLVTKYFAL